MQQDLVFVWEDLDAGPCPEGPGANEQRLRSSPRWFAPRPDDQCSRRMPRPIDRHCCLGPSTSRTWVISARALARRLRRENVSAHKLRGSRHRWPLSRPGRRW